MCARLFDAPGGALVLGGPYERGALRASRLERTSSSAKWGGIHDGHDKATRGYSAQGEVASYAGIEPATRVMAYLFQAAVGALPVANGVLLTVQAFLSEQNIRDSISPWIFALVNVSVIVGAYLAKLVAQLMAHPSVNRWIEANASPLAPTPRTGK